MHGSVFLDEKEKFYARQFCEQRTARECEEITQIVGEEKLMSINCNPVLPGFTAPKILWLKTMNLIYMKK